MSKIVPSYRFVIEGELKGLRSLLVFPCEADEAAFEELTDMFRNNAIAGVMPASRSMFLGYTKLNGLMIRQKIA